MSQLFQGKTLCDEFILQLVTLQDVDYQFVIWLCDEFCQNFFKHITFGQ